MGPGIVDVPPMVCCCFVGNVMGGGGVGIVCKKSKPPTLSGPLRKGDRFKITGYPSMDG